MRPDPAPLTARSLLGGDLAVQVSRRLSMRDLAVLAAAADLLPQDGEPDAPTSLYQLAGAVYGTRRELGRHPGGREYGHVLSSLDRLVEITLKIPGYDVVDGRVVGNLAGRSTANLLEGVYVAHERLQLVTPAQRGGLKGAANVKVAFARWFARQVRAGYATYLDLVMFRRLGVGLAARIWAYLEAESYELKGRDRETKAIGLGPPAVAALDLAGYKRARDARRALSRAAERIVVTDPRYEAVDVRPGVYGYDLYVVRRRGDRLREHRRVREALRTSLRDA